jgi:small subunit ribosomal protein S4
MKGGSLSPRRPSDYALQLREKQQLKQVYGMLEKPFRRYVRHAERMSGVAGEMLLQLLEQRLDNVVYRAGLTMSRPQARQWVRHRHFSVNGHTVDVPSYQVRPGDVIQVREEFRASGHLLAAREAGAAGGNLSWIRVEPAEFKVEILSNPPRQEIASPVDETTVMEFYSR